MMFDDDYFIESPLGKLTITASQKGVTSITFGESVKLIKNIDNIEARNHQSICKQQLLEYFAGQRTVFSVSLDFTGTCFQHSVWKVLLQIHYGKTMTYKELASVIGNSNASRAVGMANNKNPLPIIIPCHRVIGSSGKMVGYAGDIWRKEWLLNHEI
jgi:O-6-methylguanine DNA methyltransferase